MKETDLMKKIGITQRLEYIESHKEIRESLDIRWYDLLRYWKYEPVVLSSKMNISEHIANLNLSGIIFTGGNDLSVISYTEINKLRDDFEKKLITFCVNNNIRILGVCRGMQIMAHYFGASFKKVDNHVANEHIIKVDLDSCLHDMLGNEYVKVNSYHNYCIDNINHPDFDIVARSNDGAIESIASKSKQSLGIMWHPEREVSFNNWVKGFFD